MSPDPLSRRSFLRALPIAVGSLVAIPSGLVSDVGGTRVPSRAEHPEPRPGIDGSKVLGAADLEGMPDVVPIYDGIREFAHLADGVRCYCGCANMPGYRSLLTCYEEGGMAMHCPICQGQGELLVGRAREGQSLDRIRRAIDARWAHLEPNR